MKKYIGYKVLIVVLGLVALSACEKDEIVIYTGEQQDQIHVIGSATVKSSPDIAVAQIGVQTFSKELEPAVDENNEKAEKVIQALLGQGVEEKDIQTASFNVYPQKDYKDNRQGEIIGYQVNNMISVTLRDLNSVGKVLQMTLRAGANNISGLAFTLADPDPLRNEARTKAIQDARKRAEIMAEAAEIELGKVVSITELSQPVPIMARASYDEAGFKAEVPIQTGELELTVQIQVVFAIL